jgi:hypothetical protein
MKYNTCEICKLPIDAPLWIVGDTTVDLAKIKVNGIPTCPECLRKILEAIK